MACRVTAAVPAWRPQLLSSTCAIHCKLSWYRSGAATVAAGVLRGLVGDTRLAQKVAQQTVTPVEAVVVVAPHVQQDAGQFAEIVLTFAPVDDGVEAQPTLPDILDQLAARVGDGQVDVERRIVEVGRVARAVCVDELRALSATGPAGASGQIVSR